MCVGVGTDSMEFISTMTSVVAGVTSTTVARLSHILGSSGEVSLSELNEED